MQCKVFQGAVGVFVNVFWGTMSWREQKNENSLDCESASFAYTMDHGCHKIDGNCGSRGLDMPEDINI